MRAFVECHQIMIVRQRLKNIGGVHIVRTSVSEVPPNRMVGTATSAIPASPIRCAKQGAIMLPRGCAHRTSPPRVGRLTRGAACHDNLSCLDGRHQPAADTRLTIFGRAPVGKAIRSIRAPPVSRPYTSQPTCRSRPHGRCQLRRAADYRPVRAASWFSTNSTSSGRLMSATPALFVS